MSELTSCCPSCKVTFQVTAVQLQAAGGKVRCGLCQHVFNAYEHEVKEQDIDIDIDDDVLIYDDMPLPGEQQPTDTDSEQSEQEENNVAAEDEDRLPIPDIKSFDLEQPATNVSTKQQKAGKWTVLIALSCLLLLVQYVHFNANTLAKRHQLESWVTGLCTITGCTISQQDIDQITIGNLLIQSHPTSTDALKVSLTLSNNADHQQPFPNLVLIFENLDGQVVASRQFSPAEYLENKQIDATRMPSNQPVYIELDIIDPGDEAQSYSLLLN